VTTRYPSAGNPGFTAAILTGLIFFAACTWASYARWANFEYRSFDLAFYVQALWQFIHGRFAGSILEVPLLGNHVEPIVFLLAPVFFVFRHPITLVVVQNAALAAMAPMAFCIGRRLGLNAKAAFLLAAALLFTPATAYIALHEFHPEAFAAPCLLVVIWGRLQNSVRLHWLGIVALLACKENMALLIVAYGTVHLFLERRRPGPEIRSWYLWPALVATVWFLLCAKAITPALNSGSIDYLALYDRLGHSPGEILLNAVIEPRRIFNALVESLRHGNLFWGLLLPFLGLPLLRPRWILIGAPILLQHLLSWRSSEWQIYFHYAAPLVPLFWIAVVEGLSTNKQLGRIGSRFSIAIPALLLSACIGAQLVLGPAAAIGTSFTQWRAGKPERIRKTALLEQITPAASVVAPLPYLSHLATREKIYSLHFILKGLKTLSRSRYEPPPPTDFVLIDYDDTATFDPAAGYYHPAMKTVDGALIASSDRLLHDFLKRASWTTTSSNELTLFRQAPPEQPAIAQDAGKPVAIDSRTTLQGIEKTNDVLAAPGLDIVMSWTFEEPRELFPWMRLTLTPKDGGMPIIISHGLCSPEVAKGADLESWHLVPTPRLPAGDYIAEAVFLDYAKALWHEQNPDLPLVNSIRVPLGQIKVVAP